LGTHRLPLWCYVEVRESVNYTMGYGADSVIVVLSLEKIAKDVTCITR